MTAMLQNTQLRDIALGRYTKGKTSDITTTGPGTFQMFTVTGGEVLITALWGLVTTAATTAGETLAIQTDPTVGDTVTLVTATDIGTTDTAAGTTIGFGQFIDDPASTGASVDTVVVKGGSPLRDVLVTTGEVEAVVATASSNGVIEWYCTWVPLTPSATLTASA